MSFLARLFKVGSITDSLGVYVPAAIIQKTIGFARIILLASMLMAGQDASERGLWGAGSMIYIIVASVLTLGTDHSISRYVSFYESAGMIRQFYRRMRTGLLFLIVATGVVAFACSEPITRLAMAERDEIATVAHTHQILVCWAALSNAMLLAIYNNLLQFMLGLRAYRLVSAVQVFYGVVFTGLVAAALALWPTALTALGAHGLALGATIFIAGVLLHRAVCSPLPVLVAGIPEANIPERSPLPAPGHPGANGHAEAANGMFQKVVRFGIGSLAGALLMEVVRHISFVLSIRRFGMSSAGVFHVFFQLSQGVFLVAEAVWAVVFTHVAKRWESGLRDVAMLTLQMSYKAVAMIVLTLNLLLLATGRLWVQLLPEAYRADLPVFEGLLLFFQTLTNLALLSMLAKVREQPSVIAMAALLGGALNLLLAQLLEGLAGVAWAAGIGMYIGISFVTVVYIIAVGAKLDRGTWFVLACPGVLLLRRFDVPVSVLVAGWAAVCLAAIFTNWMFARIEKVLLSKALLRLAGVFRRGSP